MTVSDGASSASDTFTLTLERAGGGQGTVGTANDPRRCGSSCQETYTSAETVRLIATSDPQSGFAGWSGDGDCADGVVTMTANVMCRARFIHLPSGGPLDLNADGIGDIFGYEAATGGWTQWIGEASGSFSTTRGEWSRGWIVRAGDFDGNRRSDLLLYNSIDGTWVQALTDPQATSRYVSSTWSPGWDVRVLDLDADGRSDVFLYDPVEGWCSTRSRKPGAASPTPARGQWSPNWDVHAVELNGDRYPDLFLYNAETGRWFWVVNAGQGPGVARPGRTDADLYVSGSWSTGWHVVPADFNADRRTDFLLYNRTTGVWVQARTTASGFDYLSGTWDPNWTIQAGDFDGDRRDDLFLYHDGTGAWVEALVDPNGAFTYHSGRWDPGWRVVPAPFTTDARGLLLYSPSSGRWVRATPTGPGTFSYVSGTFGTELSLVATTPRTW